MPQLIAQLYPKLYALLLAVALVFAAVQPAFAYPAPTQQSNGMHSQHEQNSANATYCETECAGTVHNCCLYALCASEPLTTFQPPVTQHHQLPYFFSSRQITPPIQPPKAVWG